MSTPFEVCRHQTHYLKSYLVLPTSQIVPRTSKLIIKRPIKSKVNNISLARIGWCRHVALFCKCLYQIMVFKENSSPFDPCIKKNIDNRKGRHLKLLLLLSAVEHKIVEWEHHTPRDNTRNDNGHLLLHACRNFH